MPLKEGARNDILPFAAESRAEAGEILTQEAWENDTQRRVGHQPGIARQELANKQGRQSSLIAAAIGQFIANRFPDGVVDDGNIDKVEEGLIAAIQAIIDAAVPLPLDVENGGTGNDKGEAPSAKKLATKRKIALSGKATGTATDFDGSADIQIPVTAVSADSCTGNAATATKLATARAFRTNLASTATANFDGSAACNPGVTGVLPITNGGLGASTVAGARNNLGLGNTAGAVPIASGGTGATTAAAARVNLGFKQYEMGEIYLFRHPTLRTGFQLGQGGLLANTATLFPDFWQWTQTTEGKLVCITEADWQTRSKAVMATLSTGATITWNGIGGVPYLAPNYSTGACRMMDIRGMYLEAAGFDSLGVGAVHGDMIRDIFGSWTTGWGNYYIPTINASGAVTVATSTANQVTPSAGASSNQPFVASFLSKRIVPTGNKNAPRAFGALPCVYLGS